MKNLKPKIIVICGPTASGKSDAAIQLAKKFNGEIISADSRQVYRRMNIGTGKVVSDNQISNSKFQIPKKGRGFFSEGIQHHLIDVAEPMEDFNVSHFKKQATEAIEKILAEKKLPIICGGTGFWIDSITKNSAFPEVAPDEKLRKELNKKSAEDLFADLQKLDPKRAETIDQKNKVRLIRAIEIAKALGTVPLHETWNMEHGTKNSKYDFLEIGIDVPREILNEKIKKRLDQRFNEGMIEEVKNLHKNRVSYEWMEKIGLEYRWIARFLQKNISEKEMREKLYFDIIHYAKRQMTWLKRNKDIVWVIDSKEIPSLVEKFLEK